MTDKPDTMPPLPEPDAHRVAWDDSDGEWHQFHDQYDPLPSEWDDEPPDSIEAMFMAPKVHAYARQHAEERCAALVEALEEAIHQAVAFDGLDESKIGNAHWIAIARAALAAHKEKQ